MIHAKAWVAWLIAAMVALSATRNPLHLVLILLCISIVNSGSSAGTEISYNPVSPLRFALIVIPVSALFNAATVHFGNTVLMRLPEGWPVVGGAITLEALAFGALNGMVLTGILATFVTLNQALPIHALIGLIPRAFFPVAVVVSISLTFIPFTMRQLQQIREAQAVRGHRLRGLRDWLPLFIPLLIGGLERAMQLAEAMTARGVAGDQGTDQDSRTRGALVSGLILLLGGWLLRLTWGRELLGLGLMALGIGVVLITLWWVGRRVPRTVYRMQPWTRWDSAIVLSAAIALAFFILPGMDRTALVYTPYPKLRLPGFDPLAGIATLGLLGPAFLLSMMSAAKRVDSSSIKAN